ncbi:phospholipid/cholesterol/gamma-HCH transport system substrate-binding protein [Caulobacter ginsengisoli]|uniref:Phospholipid/cholesterol/gamma-HCH transport system substrate-binding protein n=1 Tax=Caulobacter ginsengisoli TaxID=400775 RepID=A0ABU0IP27_9CAUL|nr:MlaD family protein [Caulobacter ginsengisoli]MDQ0463765.1 phospholipid/cholesterol/gamma-HCH transport system substrate-binding protein [Caulobacter ginsengisoli]
MERNANYALVGMVTLILFVGMVIFAFWLARLQFNRDYDNYDILFIGPVRGLSEGGEVHFNGIKVGEVTKISLDKTDPNRVIARIRVTSDVPIRTDSYATLEPQGITGINYVQITAGANTKPLLKDVTPDGTVPVIKSQSSALSDLLAGGGTVLTRTIEALDRVNKVLSDENVKTFSAALKDVQAVTAEARERRQIIADAQKALQDIDKTANAITALSQSTQGLVDNDGRKTMQQLADAAAELKAASTDARTLIKKLDQPTTDFSTTTLPQLNSAIDSLQTTAESLRRLSDDVERDPRGIISKPPAKTVDVKK